MPTLKDQGFNDFLDSDADPVSGFTDEFVLIAGVNNTWDVGFVPAPTATPTDTPSATPSGTATTTPTATRTPSPTPTWTMTNTPTATSTNTPTPTPIATATATPSSTVTPTPTHSPTPSPTPFPTPVGALSVKAVFPTHARNDEPLSLLITGENFWSDAQVWLGAQELATSPVDSSSLLASVPAGVAPGVYGLTVASGGQSITLPAAFTARSNGNDLFSASSGLWTEPITPRSGAANVLGLTVHRNAAADSSSLVGVRVDFYLGNPATGAPLIGSTSADVLPPQGWSDTAPVNWTPDVGLHTVYALIDPANVVAEINDNNNVVSRTITVLGDEEDLSPPVVAVVEVAGGALTTTDRNVTVNVIANDPPPGNGVSHVRISEFVCAPGTDDWEQVAASAWIDFPSTPATYSWQLSPGPGAKMLRVFAADAAGNISAFEDTLINYLAPAASLVAGETHCYRFPGLPGLAAAAEFRLRITPLSGDPDLYIWPPDFATNGGQYSIKADGQDELTLIPMLPGEYGVEVFGYTDASYTLEANPVGQLESATQMDARAAVANAEQKKPKSEPSFPPDALPVTREAVPLPPGSAMDYRMHLPIVMR